MHHQTNHTVISQGLGLVGTLLVDTFAVLVGRANYFLSVLVVIINLDPATVFQIGHRTLLAIWFPNNRRSELAFPEVLFRPLASVLVPVSRKPVLLASPVIRL